MSKPTEAIAGTILFIKNTPIDVLAKFIIAQGDAVDRLSKEVDLSDKLHDLAWAYSEEMNTFLLDVQNKIERLSTVNAEMKQQLDIATDLGDNRWKEIEKLNKNNAEFERMQIALTAILGESENKGQPFMALDKIKELALYGLKGGEEWLT